MAGGRVDVILGFHGYNSQRIDIVRVTIGKEIVAGLQMLSQSLLNTRHASVPIARQIVSF